MAPTKPIIPLPKITHSAVSSTFNDWCQMTTLNGVHDFCKSKNIPLKALWIAIVLTGCVIAVSQCADFILDYAFEQQWVTNVYVKIPTSEEIHWPLLRICYKNRIEAYDWTKYSDLIGPDEFAFISARDEGLNFYRKFTEDNDDAGYRAIDVIRNRAIEFESRIKDSWEDVCRRTVIHCGINDGFTSTIDCNCSSFAISSSHRDCFVLKLEDVHRYYLGDHNESGYENGILLLLNPRTNEYRENVLYTDKLSAALNFYIHLDGEESSRYSKPTLAAAGSHILVSMQVELRRTIPTSSHTFQFYRPTPPCFEKVDYKWLNTTYSSRSLCREDCIMEFAIRHCHCALRLYTTPLKYDLRTCTEMEDYFCQRDMKTIKPRRTHRPLSPFQRRRFNLSQCYDRCIEPCEYREITTDISMASFPAKAKLEAFTNYLNKAAVGKRINFSVEDAEQMTLIEFFFASKEYKMVERVAKTTLEALISDIGGTLGVWTGLSLIGIFQAFMYVIYGIYSSFVGCCRIMHNRVGVTVANQ